MRYFKTSILILLALTGQEAKATTIFDKIITDFTYYTRRSSAPSSPVSGQVATYVLNSDGKYYVKNSSGTAKACTFSGDIVNADLSGSAGVTNANLASMANSTIKCRTTSGTGAPEDCTSTQINSILGVASNPMTTLGDTIYGGSSGVQTRLAGQTTATKKFFTQTGTGSGSAIPAWDTIVSGDLPTAQVAVPGAVIADTCLAHNFMTAIVAGGTLSCNQPAFSDISSTITTAQIGALQVTGAKIAGSTIDLTTKVTGILPVGNGGTGADLSATGGTSQFLKQASSGAVVTVVRPACADLSNAASSCSTDATNASNIGSGTLPAGRLPNPSSSTLGGIQSAAAQSNKWIDSISTSGVPGLSQPAFSNISGNITVSQMNSGTSASGTTFWRGDGTWATPAGGSGPNSHIFLDGGNGHGGSVSGETRIRNWTNSRDSTGSDITYTARTTTAGDKFTINTTGGYSITECDKYSASLTNTGISVNASGGGLTTNISSLTYANGFRGSVFMNTDEFTCFSILLALTATDVVRSHDDGNNDSSGSNRAFFSITRVY